MALVDLRRTELATRAGLEIGPDGLGFDPAVALNNDGISRLRDRDARRRHSHNPGPDKESPEDQTDDG